MNWREFVLSQPNIATPAYLYDLPLLDLTLDKVKSCIVDRPDFHVHYALKANVDNEVLNRIVKAGFGADCVSGNEVQRAIDSGFTSNKVVFAGVGKTDKEIVQALKNNIFCFNCESLHEMEVINELAGEHWTKASIAIRINPHVDANTHHYITTGLEENKFGINPWELDDVLKRLKAFTNLELKGIHFHVGSQITNLSVFKELCGKINGFNQYFREKGIILKVINVGGGLGIDYKSPDQTLIPDFESYFTIFKNFLELYPGQEVHFELGRSIVAQCGTLLSKVTYIKESATKKFAILDAGMTELIRPALYQAHHHIENLNSKDSQQVYKYDVVGPVCESSDCFAKSIDLPELKRGHIVAIRSAGAYGEVMVSNYNLRENPSTLYID